MNQEEYKSEKIDNDFQLENLLLTSKPCVVNAGFIYADNVWIIDDLEITSIKTIDSINDFYIGKEGLPVLDRSDYVIDAKIMDSPENTVDLGLCGYRDMLSLITIENLECKRAVRICICTSNTMVNVTFYKRFLMNENHEISKTADCELAFTISLQNVTHLEFSGRIYDYLEKGYFDLENPATKVTLN